MKDSISVSSAVVRNGLTEGRCVGVVQCTLFMGEESGNALKRR